MAQGQSPRDLHRVPESLQVSTDQHLSVGELLKGRTRGNNLGKKNLVIHRASGRVCVRALPQWSGRMSSRIKAVLILPDKA